MIDLDELVAVSEVDDGDQLLDEVLTTIKNYVVLDEHAAVADTLWIAMTHALPAFECAPRLVVHQPRETLRENARTGHHRRHQP